MPSIIPLYALDRWARARRPRPVITDRTDRSMFGVAAPKRPPSLTPTAICDIIRGNTVGALRFCPNLRAPRHVVAFHRCLACPVEHQRNAVYQLVVLKNETCKQGCTKTYSPDEIELFLQMAVEQYRINMYARGVFTNPCTPAFGFAVTYLNLTRAGFWITCRLRRSVLCTPSQVCVHKPCAVHFVFRLSLVCADNSQEITTYTLGIPLAHPEEVVTTTTDAKGGEAGHKEYYLNNHVHFVVYYHQLDNETAHSLEQQGNLIVGFEVHSYSIQHQVSYHTDWAVTGIPALHAHRLAPVGTYSSLAMLGITFQVLLYIWLQLCFHLVLCSHGDLGKHHTRLRLGPVSMCYSHSHASRKLSAVERSWHQEGAHHLLN